MDRAGNMQASHHHWGHEGCLNKGGGPKDAEKWVDTSHILEEEMVVLTV